MREEPSRYAPTVRAENTVDLLMSTARGLRRALAAAMAGWDVTPHHARALRVVCDQGRARPSAIAGELRIAPRAATEVVDGLAERRLVERSPDPADRRATIVRATPAGHRLREELDRVRACAAEEFLAVLPESDRRTLDRILRTLVEEEH